ncbi:MAG: M20/M25/M40 family metallo-hydrolase [Candidatus Binatia bacterium]|nr:M20/M25/M40 family metallo-hydrolase [Candidatus Binatia bacterium]
MTQHRNEADRERRAHDWIRALSEMPHRIAGSLYERQSAEMVGDWLRALGFANVQIVPVRGGPRPGLALALHAAVGLLGVVWGGLIGLVLSALAAWSFYREHVQRRPLLSRLLRAPDSVDVLARHGAPNPSLRIVLSAHIDTTEAGFLFSPVLASWFAAWNRRNDETTPPSLPPLALPFWLLIGGVAVATGEWMGAHGFFFATLRLGIIFGLALATALGLQWAMARPTPGANDNASAVAAMLLAAEQLKDVLPASAELMVVGTGAEECGCGGMVELLEGHPHWDRERTVFINFECVGGGELRYVLSEGLLGRTFYPPELLCVARRVAASGRFGRVTPVHLLAGTDGNVPARHSFPTLSLITLEENGVPRNYHQPNDTVERIDLPTVVRAADFGVEVIRQLLSAS